MLLDAGLKASHYSASFFLRFVSINECEKKIFYAEYGTKYRVWPPAQMISKGVRSFKTSLVQNVINIGKNLKQYTHE